MELILVRHGRTRGNIERRFSGSETDDPLVPEGIRELSVFRDIDPDGPLFVSPMIRARQTASIMFPGKEHNVMHDLREISFGIFEGKNHEELDGDPDYQKWLDSGGWMTIPGGESLESFRDRCMGAVRKAVKKAFSNGSERVYMVTHGGTIMAVMSVLTGEDYFELNPPNGGGYIIDLEVDDEGNITAAGAYDRLRGGVHPGPSDW